MAKGFLTTAFKQEIANRAEGYSNFSVTEEDATHCHILLPNAKDMDGADSRVSREVECGTKMSILIIVPNLRKHKITICQTIVLHRSYALSMAPGYSRA